ncbi:MAG: S8 family serine peptidase [Conexibacter sp.]
MASHPSRNPPLPRAAKLLGLSLLAFALIAPSRAAAAPRQAYVPGTVIVGYAPHAGEGAVRTSARAVGAQISTATAGAPRVRVLHVPIGEVRATVARLRRRRDVAYAAPDPIAHASALAPGAFPNDPGIVGFPGGLAGLQWNFFGPFGVNAQQAWANVAAAGSAGGRGVRIAVLDTGVAYRNAGRFRASPDFAGTRFVAGHDFVAGTGLPLDREPQGHGTHVTGTIAETTDNGIGVSGLAWGATIVPVRVLDAHGYGDATTIARGIRYAARHGAQVINMSLEFSTSVRDTEIPDILHAIRFAHHRGAVVVASAGNEGEATVAYPARAGLALSVGATTSSGCLADFSNDGVGLDLVAPGGGDDADISRDPNCRPGTQGSDVYQETYAHAPATFGLPSGFTGTSMAAPHVSAAAALVFASRVLGARPTPDQVVCRLKATARPLGLAGPNRIYGYGLVDAAAATSPAVQTPACVTAR